MQPGVMSDELNDRINSLTQEQKDIFEAIDDAVTENRDSSKPNVFFVDGPGGSGK